MDSIEQIKKISDGFLPVIALGGSERALVDEAIVRVRERVLDNKEGNINHHIYTASKTDIVDILSTLNTLPFIAKKRLVELYGAESLKSKDVAKLGKYIESPCNSSVLLMVFSKIDKRSKIYNLLFKKNIIYNFDKPTEEDVLKFIEREAQKLKLGIDDEGKNFMSINLGKDLLSIRNGMEKLSLIYENKTLGISEIALNVTGQASLDAFKLAQLIGEGNLADALYLLGKLRGSKECPVKFLGLLAWQFRTLLRIRDLLDKNLSDWQIKKEVAVFGTRYNQMKKIATKKNKTYHIARLTRLLHYDAAIKGKSRANPFTIIEKLAYHSAIGLA